MKKTENAKFYLRFAILFLLMTGFTSCVKEPDDLQDPSVAGKWELFNTSTGLPGNQVKGIIHDSRNIIWFAISSNGAAKIEDGVFSFLNTSNSPLISNSVKCIEEDYNGNIYFGTTNGYSIMSATGEWSFYRDPVVTMNVTSIKAASDGSIWIGTTNQGFFVSTNSGVEQVYVPPFTAINDIEEDIYGNIWLATDYGALVYDHTTFYLFTTEDGLADDWITSLYCDSKGIVWIGTYLGKSVTYFNSEEFNSLSLMNGDTFTRINDIYEDRKGDLWFATYNSGLIRYDGVVCHSFKEYNGFTEDDVLSIGEDSNGNMWFGLYTTGLVKYTLPLN